MSDVGTQSQKAQSNAPTAFCEGRGARHDYAFYHRDANGCRDLIDHASANPQALRRTKTSTSCLLTSAPARPTTSPEPLPVRNSRAWLSLLGGLLALGLAAAGEVLVESHNTEHP